MGSGHAKLYLLALKSSDATMAAFVDLGTADSMRRRRCGVGREDLFCLNFHSCSTAARVQNHSGFDPWERRSGLLHVNRA
jgi:hypothetical protein